MATGTSHKLKYVLTCECGQAHRVDTSQAGQSLECTCGRALEVPTLRGIRQLPQVQEERRAETSAPSWNRTRGVLFAGGLLTATVCLAIAALLLVLRVQVDDSPPEIDFEREARSAVEGLTLDESWDFWTEARRSGLGPYRTPPHVLMREYRGELAMGIGIATAIGVAGIGAVVTSLLMKR